MQISQHENTTPKCFQFIYYLFHLVQDKLLWLLLLLHNAHVVKSFRFVGLEFGLSIKYAPHFSLCFSDCATQVDERSKRFLFWFSLCILDNPLNSWIQHLNESYVCVWKIEKIRILHFHVIGPIPTPSNAAFQIEMDKWLTNDWIA